MLSAACDPGYRRDPGSNQCVKCAIGFYQPLKWQDQCLPCNQSYSTRQEGSTNSSECECEYYSFPLSNFQCFTISSVLSMGLLLNLSLISLKITERIKKKQQQQTNKQDKTK